MVGHTHEDIDQMFSCFSRHLAKKDARTIPELFTEMEKAYTPSPTCEQLLHMFDVKEWMHGHVVDGISGHVHQHQFKFIKSNGNVVTFYKKWSTTKEWSRLQPRDNTDPIYTMVKSIPKGSPTYVKPSLDASLLTKINRDLVKFNAKFDSVTTDWWSSFIKKLQTASYTPLPWCLDSLLSINKSVPPLIQACTEEDEVELRIGEEIERLLAKETKNTEVTFLTLK